MTTETKFKARYKKEVIALVDKCMQGETGEQAILIVHTPHMRTVSLYALNADASATQSIILSAAEPYLSRPQGKGH